jgi:hypothetical protein
LQSDFVGLNSKKLHLVAPSVHRNSLPIALWQLGVIHKVIVRAPGKICLLELVAIADFISSIEPSSGFAHHLPFAKAVMLSFYATKAVHWDFFSATWHKAALLVKQ